jgi:sugar/nucleoside kinase (ribokinase family)
VLIDPSGERSFVHCVGAPRLLDKHAMLSRLDLFAQSRAMLIGYYPLMTRLQGDLPEVFAAIRETGCLTAIDAAGDGGTMDPLARILPHTDFYVPNETEAAHQTGRNEPRAMIAAYREAGAKGWLGIKLGAKGALLSPRPGRYDGRRRLLLWSAAGGRVAWFTAGRSGPAGRRRGRLLCDRPWRDDGLPRVRRNGATSRSSRWLICSC